MKVQTLFYLIIVLIFCISGILFSQTYYTGPNSGSISGGAIVSTTAIEFSTQVPKGPRIHNPFWKKFDPVIPDDSNNKIKPTAPLYSNEIYDKIIEKNQMFSDSTAAIVIDFKGNPQTSSIPPDPIMAVGPDHIISCVNTGFIIFDKQGNQLFSTGAEVWFNNVFSNNGAFDPTIIYDHFSGRWVQLWDSQPDGTTDAYYLVSVSDDSNPMGTWYNYAFPTDKNGSIQTAQWSDYPKLGYDANAIYMSGRMFSFSGFFNYSHIRWVGKSELYNANGGPVTYTDIWDLRDPSGTNTRVDGPPVAAVHMDSTDTGYLVVDSPYFTGTFVTLWKIQDPLGTPIISATNVPVTATTGPYNGQQLGGNQALDVGRRAYRNSVYQNGMLWTCANVGGTGASTFARYLKIDVTTNTAIEDYSIGASGYYYLYPAIMVDEHDNMVMAYTRSGYTEYAGVGYTGRRDSDPAGYLSPTIILKEGEANYVKTYGGTRNRWGDYMGIDQDPANRSIIWALVEYAESPANTWGVWIAGFTHSYSAYGVVNNSVTQLPIEFANVEIVESGNVIVTDSTGTFAFGSPTQTININVNAFAFQDTSISKSLTLYTPDEFNITLMPEIESTISGQVVDSNGVGVYAELKFFAEGNPYPGPYATVQSDPNGNYSLTTIIGKYEIEIYPESPFAYKKITEIFLGSGGLQQGVIVSKADIMLVDDDNGESYEEYYFEDFQAIGKTYHHWEVQVSGVPSAADRNAYPDKIMFWFTGDSSSSPLIQAEQNEILDHITTGGKLFLTGQDIAEMHSGSNLTNTLGVDFAQNSTGSLIIGVSGDVIGGGLVFNVSGSGGANNQTSSDVIQITDPSTTTTIFHYGGGTSKPAAARYENGVIGSKAVFLGFGAESINDPSRRQTLLTRVIDYLRTPLTNIDDELTNGILPEKFELLQNYPNPFNPETTIKYSIREKSKVSMTIFNNLGQKVRTLLNKNMSAGQFA
ncbi:MAG: carboxypeptidase-like regulatory domain-containing protein, partial [Gammaproteobacteria bacterium]|nr:carboxypeptidase-like regulatory domain-containing protein [Gammaproteobacteria bacterium]